MTVGFPHFSASLPYSQTLLAIAHSRTPHTCPLHTVDHTLASTLTSHSPRRLYFQVRYHCRFHVRLGYFLLFLRPICHTSSLFKRGLHPSSLIINFFTDCLSSKIPVNLTCNLLASQPRLSLPTHAFGQVLRTVRCLTTTLTLLLSVQLPSSSRLVIFDVYDQA